MNRRKAAVGVLVLCALYFSVFAASGASAAGTTAGECTSNATTKDFEDAHCDRARGLGTFGHILFPDNTPTSVSGVNDLTGTSAPFVLSGKIAGIVVHIQCNTATAAFTVTNKTEGAAMKLAFGELSGTFTSCAVTTPQQATPCVVTITTFKAVISDPMNLRKGATTTDVTGNSLPEPVEEAAGATEMGLKFSAPPGGPLFHVTFSGAQCPAFLVGTFPATGSVVATGGRGSASSVTSSGATHIFTKASTIKFLKFAGNPATLEGTFTFRKEGGNPLIITTTAS
jgi:hypothetical protein